MKQEETSSTEEEQSVSDEEDKVRGKRRFKCDQCGKWFVRRHALKEHVETHLDPDKRNKWSCHLCEKTFFHKKNYDTTHQISSQQDEDSYLSGV